MNTPVYDEIIIFFDIEHLKRGIIDVSGGDLMSAFENQTADICRQGVEPEFVGKISQFIHLSIDEIELKSKNHISYALHCPEDLKLAFNMT